YRGEGSIIVAVTPTTVQVHRGNLARRSRTTSADCAGHSASEEESGLVGQIAPEVVDVDRCPLRVAEARLYGSFFGGHSRRATAEPGAISGAWTECRLKPGLYGNPRCHAVRRSEVQVHVVVRIGKGLPVKGEHVRHRVEVRGLVFVLQNATDVAD